MERWSRDLAAAQTVAVVEAGGRTVSMGDLLGPTFRASPLEMFSHDGLHPSSAGYARAAAALLPSVVDALGMRTLDTGRTPDLRRGERVEPLAQAAERAVLDPGSEVSAVDVDGRSRSERGRWAQLLRRNRNPNPAIDPDPAADSAASTTSADATTATNGAPNRTTEPQTDEEVAAPQGDRATS